MRLLHDRRGNALLTFALLAPVLAVLVGSAVSFARADSVGRNLQDGADTAALAAAVMILRQDASNPEAAAGADRVARRAAEASGDAPLNVATTVRSREPLEVEVRLSRASENLFGRLLGRGSMELTRIAVARSNPGRPICLFVLDETEPSALSVSGTADVLGPDCVGQVNSRATGAITTNGNASIRMEQVNAAARRGGSARVVPAPNYGRAPLPDPIAPRVTWPSESAGCDRGTIGSGSLNAAGGTLVICGDIRLGSRDRLTLGPGVYVVRGDVRVGSQAVLEGAADVTLVLTGATSSVDIGGGSEVNLTAPTTGPWRHLAIAVKPQPSPQTSEIGGGGSIALNGVIYLPTQTLRMGGNSELSSPNDDTRILVVDKLDLRGTAQIRLQGHRDIATAPDAPFLAR